MEASYLKVIKEINEHDAKLVAVSKKQPLEKIHRVYDLGQRAFGENRVQEFLDKYEILPDDIDWHFIGHLQTKKAKSVIGKTRLIHSVDRLKLARKINLLSEEAGIKTRVLLQVKIADEDSKYGYDFNQLKKELKAEAYRELANLTICGVMGMATFTDNMNQVRREFKQLRKHFKSLKSKYFQDSKYFREISMGMSGDYEIALEEGATIIRIGSKIFGPRIF